MPPPFDNSNSKTDLCSSMREELCFSAKRVVLSNETPLSTTDRLESLKVKISHLLRPRVVLDLLRRDCKLILVGNILTLKVDEFNVMVYFFYLVL